MKSGTPSNKTSPRQMRLGGEKLDEVIGGWPRALVGASRLDGLLTAIAIDGKWLRGDATA
jgi:hypothetical protein